MSRPRVPSESKSLVVGVVRLAWIYGRTRVWAESLLRQWEDEQLAGTAPVRVFRHGARRSLYTTTAVLHQYMPPGRDLALYRRVDTIEHDLASAHRRIDREIIERRKAVDDLARLVTKSRR